MAEVKRYFDEQLSYDVPPDLVDGKPNEMVRAKIEALALKYLLYSNNINEGKKAVSLAQWYLSQINNTSDYHSNVKAYEAIICGSIVYDWCYPLMNDISRKALRNEMMRVGRLCEYPPERRPKAFLTGHYGETGPTAFLAYGIAVSDEDSYMFDTFLKEQIEDFAPSRNPMYESGTHHQGAQYIYGRYSQELLQAYLLKKIGYDIYSPKITLPPYRNIYGDLGRGIDGIPEGDGHTHLKMSYALFYSLAAKMSGDPYLEDYAERYFELSRLLSARIFCLHDPDLDKKPVEELPLSRYFPSPAGLMIARTAWDLDSLDYHTNNVAVLMNMREYSAQNHVHLDVGNFCIFHRGHLALDAGIYQGEDANNGWGLSNYVNYYVRSIAHNTILIKDPDEPIPFEGWKVKAEARDGGQYTYAKSKWQSSADMFAAGKSAEVRGHYISDGSEPDFTYLKGDMTNAYDCTLKSEGHHSKAKAVRRSFVFMNMKDKEIPGVLIVADHVESRLPSFGKVWLLHTQNEPEINGNVVTATYTKGDRNGRIVDEVILPENPIINKIGGSGKEYLVDGKNWGTVTQDDAGRWRIELQSSEDNCIVNFLNVIQISDATPAPLKKKVSTAWSADKNRVAICIGDRIVCQRVLQDNSSADVTFRIGNSKTEYKVLVTDLSYGAWSVSSPSGSHDIVVDKESGTAEFKANGGIISLKKKRLSASHPVLALSKEDVQSIKEGLNGASLFDKSISRLIHDADSALTQSICIPVPVDGGGGNTHQQHKKNYYSMFNCGLAYQYTGDERYFNYVRSMLLEYAKMYPTLGFHPRGNTTNTPGRLFWQTLNENVWLVHTSIGYDCIREKLSSVDRSFIEDNLFRPMADFIMNGMDGNTANRKVFNMMHNHGTWAVAAVGMIGMAMDDQVLVDKALYGSDMTGNNGGFLMQLRKLFSPDGYYTEGAYYLRYAIWPIVLFAQSIERYRPNLGIFQYRDNIISKAVDVLIQETYNHKFFQFNDAMNKMDDSQELLFAADIIYDAFPQKKYLLSLVKDRHNAVIPLMSGYVTAKAIEQKENQPMRYHSMILRDGAEGNDGAFVIMRTPDESSALTFKATSHGLSHGHFDRLNISWYDNNNEILTDYGSARFVEINSKSDGRYTPENKSYAMATIAHNTVCVDESQNFGGDRKKASASSPKIVFCDLSNPDTQIVQAEENNAFEGVSMRRTTALIKSEYTEAPIVFDIFRIASNALHTYDYAIHYQGHIMNIGYQYDRFMDEMKTLGSRNGYQHLWVESKGYNPDMHTSWLTWLEGGRFYTFSTATNEKTVIYNVLLGANDMNYILRRDPGFIIREQGVMNHTFCSVLESHGCYNLQIEIASSQNGLCKEVKILAQNDDCTVVSATFPKGTVIVCISDKDDSADTIHEITTGEKTFSWKGHYSVIRNNN